MLNKKIKQMSKKKQNFDQSFIWKLVSDYYHYGYIKVSLDRECWL